MKAIQLHQYGGAEVLEYTDVQKPVAGADEVLIKVKAAALNPVDSKVRNGYMNQVFPLTFPFTPGWEASGTITETGSNVTELKPGDDVVVRTPFPKAGAYAEYMVADKSGVVLKPASISFIEAATLPIVAGAAWTCLYKAATIQAGQKVFILGAAGSVGLVAVQLAKVAGAIVVGTATGDDIALLKSVGADEVIDYLAADYTESVHDADLVLDFVGGPAQDDLWKILKKGGTLLSTATPPAPEKAQQYGVNASFVFTQPDKILLEKVTALAGEGKIKVKIGKVLPLADAQQAHRLMDGRQISGKIVLEMD